MTDLPSLADLDELNEAPLERVSVRVTRKTRGYHLGCVLELLPADADALVDAGAARYVE